MSFEDQETVDKALEIISRRTLISIGKLTDKLVLLHGYRKGIESLLEDMNTDLLLLSAVVPNLRGQLFKIHQDAAALQVTDFKEIWKLIDMWALAEYDTQPVKAPEWESDDEA